MKVKVDIDTKVFVRLVLVVLGFGLLLMAIYKVRTALTLIGMSAFLAMALNPPVSKISQRLPGKSRVGATAIAYLMVVALIAGFIVLIVPPVIEQSSKFASTVPDLIDSADKNRYIFDNLIDRYNLESAFDDAVTSAKEQADNIAGNIGNLLVGGATAFLGGIASTALVLVLAFLMLVEGPVWMRRVWGLYEDPVQLERHQSLVRRMYHVVTGFVNGQLTVAMIAAVCALIVLLSLSATLGLPTNLAVPLAVIVFISGMIPMIGSTIGGILVSLVLLMNSPTAMVIFLIYFIIYQQIENNFISPTIQSKNVELSALLILTAILIGGSLYGLLGAAAAIPVAGCIRVLFLDQLDHAKNKRLLAERNPVKKFIRRKAE